MKSYTCLECEYFKASYYSDEFNLIYGRCLKLNSPARSNYPKCKKAKAKKFKDEFHKIAYFIQLANSIPHV